MASVGQNVFGSNVLRMFYSKEETFFGVNGWSNPA